jgi:integrase/recombinase XerD
VNQLRQLMLEELHRRNFAETTIRTYMHGVTHFSQYFRRPPDQLARRRMTVFGLNLNWVNRAA